MLESLFRAIADSAGSMAPNDYPSMVRELWDSIPELMDNNEMVRLFISLTDASNLVCARDSLGVKREAVQSYAPYFLTSCITLSYCCKLTSLGIE